MKIKDARSFRQWYKVEERELDEKDKRQNENFLGTYHQLDENTKVKGFFEMYHGDKPDIASYLPSILKIAEDGQAIYEFLQNAVDCKSTHFYIFYNEKYFIALNNGEAFHRGGVKAILNIAQTDKHSCDKIGRFGIGFKLAHRLVGKTEGVEELVKDYKGPVLFSWSKLKQFKSFLEEDMLEKLTAKDEGYNDAPYLFKILLTNFPAAPGEIVKDLEYKDLEAFPTTEVSELTAFLKENLDKHEEIDLSALEQGSLFFIKLGEGKKDVLDRDYDKLRKGIQYSMNLLDNLKTIYVNEQRLDREDLVIIEDEIAKSSEAFERINPEYKDCNIKIALGYYSDYRKGLKIAKEPNFYKYFPMGDEVNGLNFIVHSDSLSNEANRRKLQEDEVNKHLLPEIANFIKGVLLNHKKNSFEEYLELYASIICSGFNEGDHNQWIRNVFFSPLVEFLKTNIPLDNGDYESDNNCVKIKLVKTTIPLASFGITNYEWFYWSKKEQETIIISNAREKLKLESWRMKDLLWNAKEEETNSTLESLLETDPEQLYLFLKEVWKITSLDDQQFEKFRRFKLLLFKDQGEITLRSIDDIFKQEKYILLKNDYQQYKPLLERLGFKVAEHLLKDDNRLTNLISSYLRDTCSDLSIFKSIQRLEGKGFEEFSRKKRIETFRFLKSLRNVGPKHLKTLRLFKNQKGDFMPLGEMLPYTEETPNFLSAYTLNKAELYDELTEYVLPSSSIYEKIILPKWGYLIEDVDETNVVEFYSFVKANYVDTSATLPINRYYTLYPNSGEPCSFWQGLFFNNNFKQLGRKEYDYFETAYKTISNKEYPLPLFETLEFLGKPPFNVNSASLLSRLDSDKAELPVGLSELELKAILKFCSLNKEFFLNEFFIQENKKDESYLYTLYKKNPTDLGNLILKNKELESFFLALDLKGAALLPSEFHELGETQGVKKDKDLLKFILEELTVEDYLEQLLEILEEAKDPELNKRFLKKVWDITLSLDAPFSKEDLNLRLLVFAIQSLKMSHEKEHDLSQIQQKVKLKTDGECLALNDIPKVKDIVSFDDGLELSLSKLLPNEYEQAKYRTKLVNELGEVLKDDLTPVQLNNFFALEEEMGKEEILERLAEKLENAEQLLFILKIKDEKGFFYEDIDGNWWGFEGPVFLEEQLFIKREKVLSDRYNDFFELVDVDEKKYYKVYQEPFWTDKDSYFIHIKEPLAIEEQTSLLNFIYEAYQREEPYVKEWLNKKDGVDQLFGKHLGGSIRGKIKTARYARSSEQLTPYILNWAQEDQDKEHFLKELGVLTDDEPMLEFRAFLLGEEKTDIYETISLISPRTALATIEFVKEKEIVVSSYYKEFKLFIREKVKVKRPGGAFIYTEVMPLNLNNRSKKWSASYYEEAKREGLVKNEILLKNEMIKCQDKLIFLDVDGQKKEIFSYEYELDYYFDSKTKNIYLYIGSEGDDDQIISVLEENKDDLIGDIEGLKKAKFLDTIKQEHLLLEKKYKTIVEENQSLKDKVNALEKELNSRATSVNESSLFYRKSNPYFNEIGLKAEELLYEYLKKKYEGSTVNVIWQNENGETSSPYDFILKEEGKRDIFIECKGTSKSQPTTFHLPLSEWNVFLKNIDSYKIYYMINCMHPGQEEYIEMSLKESLKKGEVIPYAKSGEEWQTDIIHITVDPNKVQSKKLIDQ